MFPEKAKRIICEPIPAELIQERDGGRGGVLSYISGSFVIDTLNAAFDYRWDWQCEKEWIQESQPKFNPKYDKEPVTQGPVAHVRGKLTVYFENDKGETVSISKTGHGSKTVLGGQSDQESIFKAADTDALKKAASRFGIGQQLYRNEHEQEYAEQMENPWTEEARELYKRELTAMRALIKENNLTDEDVNRLANQFSDGTAYELGDIYPVKFPEFVAYAQEQYKAPAKKSLTKKSAPAKEAS